MSLLQTEIPSPRQALRALRKPTSTAPRPARPERLRLAPRVNGRTVVGLDIEPGFLAAVETVPGSMTVRRAAFTELDADIVKDGEVVDPAALGAALKAFFADNGLSTKVRIGLVNQRIVMRMVDLPPITDERQLASAIRFQAQEHIAMPLEQAVLDHQSLGVVGTPDGPRTRVVLVAARREMVERLLSATRIAGLRVEGIDLAAFALIRALHRPDDGEAQMAFINIASMTNLAVAAQAQCLFTRVIPVGFDAMVADLSARRGLTVEHARGWLRHVGLAAPLHEVAGEPEIVASTREVLENGVTEIAGEIRSTLSFYASQSGGVVADRAIVTGIGASIPGLAGRLAEDLGIPVEVRSISQALPGMTEAIDTTQLTVAAGLTSTEVPS